MQMLPVARALEKLAVQRGFYPSTDRIPGIWGSGQHQLHDVDHGIHGSDEWGQKSRTTLPSPAEDPEVEALPPQLVGELDKRATLGGTGAVDEDVDVVEGSCRLTMQLLTSFESRQIGWDRLDPAPGGGQ